MQNVYGEPKNKMKGCGVTDDDGDADDYENVSNIRSIPAVPAREKKGTEATGRREDLQLKCLAKPGNFNDRGKNHKENVVTRTVPTFHPPAIGLNFSSTAVNAAFRDLTDAPSSETNHKDGGFKLMIVIWLILMFVLYIIISGIMIIFYVNFSDQLSDMNQNVSLAQESTKKEIELWKEYLKKDNQANEINALKTDIKSIKKLLGLCGICPAEWTLLGSTCYFLSNAHQTWENSQKECSKLGSTLLILNSKKELESLGPVIGNKRFWIGLRKANAKNWIWVDGTAPAFTNWNNGEPNNAAYREHCTEMITGGWNDLDCSNTIDYICKRSPDC
ncbi:CD209 antigen-like protein E [Pseudophryne corroboree]|uniref:CD209 antigen-like protein E n=1 Tax=Pseudophryne corroboree TaxID=495146 RepID=UPI003081B8A9